MIWCRFEAEGKPAYGLVEGEAVREVEGSPFDAYTATDRTRSLASVRLLVPCEPPTIYACGVNYEAHARWASEYFGRDMTRSKPEVNYRGVNALLAHDQAIVIPRDSTGDIHYEAELAAIIGRQAKHLTKEDALSCVLGYTILNDVSERAWQRQDKTIWRSKNSDTFNPLGPWIVTDLDVANAETEVRINGSVASHFATGKMIYDLTTYLVETSRYLTLLPGDVMSLGTDGATVPGLPEGDVIEIEITGLGTLRNHVTREKLN